MLLIIGSIGLTQLMRRDRFELIHTVDVIQLLASGVCFGIAATLLLYSRRGLNRPN
jgi:hypothetical protein